MKQAIISSNNKEEKPKDGDIGYVIIRGIFVKRTAKKKLDELTFLPLLENSQDIQIKISTLNDVDAFWQQISHIKK